MSKYYGRHDEMIREAEMARIERARTAEAEKAKFSRDFARFCGILSGTGIGKSV